MGHEHPLVNTCSERAPVENVSSTSVKL
jgi:hypothetical protein